MTTLDGLPAAERSRLIISRRRVLEGRTHEHRSATATPEVQTFRTEDLHLTLLRDVLLHVHHGFASTRTGRILEDTAVRRGPIEAKLLSGKLLRSPTVLTVDRPVMGLECGPKNANFFHFWFESMTKLLWVAEDEVVKLGDAHLAYTRELAGWQEQLIAQALPEQVTLLRVDSTTAIEAPVYVDLPAYRGTALDVDAIEKLRRWAAPLTAATTAWGSPTRIAISRRDAGRRRLLNERALQDLLLEHGFVVVALEELPIGEQIRLFQGAEIIVAQHGAGLTHLLHARPGTKLLEILPETPERSRRHYRGISVTVGIDYSNVHCGAADRDADAAAPIELIRAWLDRLDGRPGSSDDIRQD